MCFVSNIDVTFLLQGYGTFVVIRNTCTHGLMCVRFCVAEEDVFFLGGRRRTLQQRRQDNLYATIPLVCFSRV